MHRIHTKHLEIVAGKDHGLSWLRAQVKQLFLLTLASSSFLTLANQQVSDSLFLEWGLIEDISLKLIRL